MEVGGSVSLGKTIIEKSSRNSPIPVLIFWSSIIIMCILYTSTLLNVVSYYGLSVLSMLVMGLKKKFG